MVSMGDFQHATLEIPFSCDQNTDIDTTNLYETILDQPWCLSVEKMTTQNKVLIVTTKGQILLAHEWIDNKLPEIYQQNIANKLDVTMLQQLIPCHLDKPLITAAATQYADKLKQRSSYITWSTTTMSSQFMCPPKTRQVKPATLTYTAAAAARNQPTASLTPNTPTTAMTTNMTQTSAMATSFDYHVKLQCITNEIETKLKAKLEAAIANLQAMVDALEQKSEQKLNQQIESLKLNQADKLTQDAHSRNLEGLTKSVSFLVEQVSLIADKLSIPMPKLGVGQS